jgi:DNA-binding MarR family transcriptional regulator
MSAHAKARPRATLKLADYLPYELSIASNRVSQLIARAYETRFNITVPHWRTLAVLGEASGLSQKDICARTAMDKVTISRAVAGLVRRKLVARAAHDSDGRSSRLALTREGARLYQLIAPMALDYEAALLSEISPQDLRLLRDLLARLRTRAGALGAAV